MLRLILAFAALLGTALALLATSKYGIAHHSDSARYVSVAESLRSGQGFVEYSGDPYVAAAPLYPIVLAIGRAAGFDYLPFARALHAVGFGVLIVLAGAWLARARVRPALWVIGVLAVLTSGELFDQATVALTDLLFLVLTTACLVMLDAAIATQRRRWLLASAVFAALAWLTRYIGVALAVSGALILTGFSRAVGWRRRLQDTLLFVVVATLPTAVWVARNLAVSGTYSGKRVLPTHSLADYVTSMLEVVGTWFVPPRFGSQAQIAAGVVLLLLVAGALAWAGIRASRKLAVGSALNPREITILVAAGFSLVYLTTLVVFGSVTFFSESAARYTAPAALPAIVAIIVAIDAATDGVSVPRRRLAQTLIVLTALTLLAWPSWRLRGWVRYARDAGAGGYATDHWQRSTVVRYVRDARLRSPVYSNEPNVLYLLADLPSPRWLPGHDHVTAPQTAQAALRSLADSIDLTDAAVFVVFDSAGLAQTYDYTSAQLHEAFVLDQIAALADGNIYRVRQRQR